MKNMYVYIMTNHKQGTLYVGVTNDLIRRVYEHKKKLIKGFTSRYNIDKLVYYEVYDDETTAISREKQLKKSYRKTKEQLINSMNPQWKDLYNDII
ncbi:MAG: GIY-YIG nuclease family protein [Alphaproteobacteria bacterium]